MKIQWHPYFETPGDKPGGAEKIPLGRPDKFDDDTTVLDNLLDANDKGKEAKPDNKTDDDEIIDDEDEVLDDENKEPEDKVEDDEDKELVEVESNRGLDLKAIKEKYPEFAKTNAFRELRNAYHREAQYTELFPTVEDAKEAAENNETFNKINNSLVEGGDPSILLTAIKEANPESFKKVVTSFLDTVSKIDSNSYVEAVTPIVRRLAKQIHAEGKKILSRNAESDDGKALVATARNIMLYADMDASEIEKPEVSNDNQPSERERKLNQRETEHAQREFQSAYKVAEQSVERHLDKLILDGLDPDNRFNEFTRDTLVEKIKSAVKNQVSNDKNHVNRMNSLWKRAQAAGYSRESLSSIVSAYLERVRPIIPAERTKYRGMAIKGKAESDDTENNRGMRIVSSGRSGKAPNRDGKQPRVADSKKIDYRQTSDDDILNGKVKLKA